MTQAHFDEFYKIAINWPSRSTKRINLWAIEFHRRVKEGVDPEEILRGARIYTQHHLPSIDWPVAAHTWLRDWCWMAYQEDPDAKWRPLRPEEVREWEKAFRRPPNQAPADAPEWTPETAGLRRVK